MSIFKKGVLITLAFVAIITIIVIGLLYREYKISANYNRAMYSVVLHNTTERMVNGIDIYYQLAGYSSCIEFEHIDNLTDKSYRKVNIPTNIQPPGSYNVFVAIRTATGTMEVPAGYFGTGVGGFAVIEIKIKDEEIFMERVFESESRYKRLYRRHKKNQYETCWR